MTFHEYMQTTFGSFDGIVLFQMVFVTVLLIYASRIFIQDKKAWKILKIGYPLTVICMILMITGIVLTKYVGV